MKKEKDPIEKEDKKDNFYSLFSKVIKHNPEKKKPEEKLKEDKKTKPKTPQSS